jgi:large subunit ribosomal protein L21
MYAVISIGGKQARVEVGEHVDIELVTVPEGDGLSFVPLLVVDGESVVSDPAALAGYRVDAVVTGSSAGPKITGFTYQAKARRRRRYGHRQHYTTVEITAISPSTSAAPARSEA